MRGWPKSSSVTSPTIVEAQPETLAHHCTQAGLVEKAIHYWYAAGEQATRRSAMTEAVAHLTTALKLLEQLPSGPDRARRELELWAALGGALITAKGYAAPETAAAFAQAYDLCRQLGDVERLFPALFGRYVTHLLGAKLAVAAQSATEMLHLAQEHANDDALVTSHRCLGTASFMLGDPTTARTHLERALALYDPKRHRALAFVYANDVRVAGLQWLTCALFALGYPDQAHLRSREASAGALELGHANTTAASLQCACMLSEFLGRRQDVQALAQSLIALATEKSFPYWLAMGTIMQGWTLADRGTAQIGIAQIRRGLIDWQKTGAALIVPYYMSLLARALGQDKVSRLSRYWIEPYKLRKQLGNAGSRRNCIGSRVSCCSAQSLAIGPRPRPVFSVQSVWLASSTRESWELRASRAPRLAMGRRGPAAARPAICWRQSMAGSPRASAPPTSRTPRRCSMSWHEPVSTFTGDSQVRLRVKAEFRPQL